MGLYLECLEEQSDATSSGKRIAATAAALRLLAPRHVDLKPLPRAQAERADHPRGRFRLGERGQRVPSARLAGRHRA
jgi:hypothetical protein